MRALVDSNVERAAELIASSLGLRQPEEIRDELIDRLAQKMAEKIAEEDRGQLVPAEEIAGRLAVRKQQVYELSRRALDPLPSIAVGGQKRFNVADVDDWARRQSA